MNVTRRKPSPLYSPLVVVVAKIEMSKFILIRSKILVLNKKNKKYNNKKGGDKSAARKKKTNLD